MKCRPLARTSKALVLRVSDSDLKDLFASSVSKQATFYRRAWKELNPFPQPRSISAIAVTDKRGGQQLWITEHR